MDDQPPPSPEKAPFNHDVHPRHPASGKFTPRSDIDAAMQRIHDGHQTSRATLPQPVTPDHPS